MPDAGHPAIGLGVDILRRQSTELDSPWIFLPPREPREILTIRGRVFVKLLPEQGSRAQIRMISVITL